MLGTTIKYSHRKTNAKNGMVIKGEGIYIDILDALRAKLNFTLKRVVPKKWNYGKELKNGKERFYNFTKTYCSKRNWFAFNTK